jgi:hypothetical protein
VAWAEWAGGGKQAVNPLNSYPSSTIIKEDTTVKKLVTIMVTGTILLFGVSAFALTMDEAKTNINRQATEKKLGARDHSQAVGVLQGLVDKGVPVEHAYAVVEASINQGIKGKDLAAIARSLEAVGPAGRTDAASMATEAIQHKYTAKETVQMTNTFGKTVAAGAPADKTSQVMSGGINKGLGSGRIMSVTNTYSKEVKSGMAPDKAVENATLTMDRERTMQRDHTMSRDHMGTGSGMGHDPGMEHGAGMGSGMGGPKH